MAGCLFAPDCCMSPDEMMFRDIFWQDPGKIPGGIELI